MVHMPYWLYRLVKGFVQYLGVVFAGIPGGIVYALCLKITGIQNISLVVGVTVGVFSAHLVWRMIDRWLPLRAAHTARIAIIPNSIEANNSYSFEGNLSLAAAGMVLYIIASPIYPSQSITVLQSNTPITPTARPLV